MTPHAEDQEILFHTGSYELFTPPPEWTGRIIELDLGCGVGSFTSALAQRYPERMVMAADVMVGRLRKLVRRNHRMAVTNVLPFRVEARHLVALMLPDGGIDRLHILCPDPWPKDRHRGHRLLSSDFVVPLHRVLKLGGIFHFSSDDEPYFDAVTEVLTHCGLFEIAPEAIADIADVKSDFELRWNGEGKAVRHQAWRTVPLKFNGIGH